MAQIRLFNMEILHEPQTDTLISMWGHEMERRPIRDMLKKEWKIFIKHFHSWEQMQKFWIDYLVAKE